MFEKFDSMTAAGVENSQPVNISHKRSLPDIKDFPSHLKQSESEELMGQILKTDPACGSEALLDRGDKSENAAHVTEGLSGATVDSSCDVDGDSCEEGNTEPDDFKAENHSGQDCSEREGNSVSDESEDQRCFTDPCSDDARSHLPDQSHDQSRDVEPIDTVTDQPDNHATVIPNDSDLCREQSANSESHDQSTHPKQKASQDSETSAICGSGTSHSLESEIHQVGAAEELIQEPE